MTLAIDILDGHGHINTARHERLLKKTKALATKGLPERRSALFMKVIGQMHNIAKEGHAAFGFTVIVSA